MSEQGPGNGEEPRHISESLEEVVDHLRSSEPIEERPKPVEPETPEDELSRLQREFKELAETEKTADSDTYGRQLAERIKQLRRQIHGVQNPGSSTTEEEILGMPSPDEPEAGS